LQIPHWPLDPNQFFTILDFNVSSPINTCVCSINPTDLSKARTGRTDPLSWRYSGKSRAVAVKIDDLPTPGNILKQTAMACGGDCAVNRAIVSGRVRRTSAVLFVTMRQLPVLLERLASQPECVARLVPELVEMSGRLALPARTIKLRRKMVDLGRRIWRWAPLTLRFFLRWWPIPRSSAALDHAGAMAEAGADHRHRRRAMPGCDRSRQRSSWRGFSRCCGT
jgi:hypothetical protein